MSALRAEEGPDRTSAQSIDVELIRGFAVWLVLFGAKFVHGIARAIRLVPLVGDFRARQIGVFTGSIINLTIAALIVRWIHSTRGTNAITIGVLWLVLTVT